MPGPVGRKRVGTLLRALLSSPVAGEPGPVLCLLCGSEISCGQPQVTQRMGSLSSDPSSREAGPCTLDMCQGVADKEREPQAGQGALSAPVAGAGALAQG